MASVGALTFDGFFVSSWARNVFVVAANATNPAKKVETLFLVVRSLTRRSTTHTPLFLILGYIAFLEQMMNALANPEEIRLSVHFSISSEHPNSAVRN